MSSYGTNIYAAQRLSQFRQDEIVRTAERARQVRETRTARGVPVPERPVADTTRRRWTLALRRVIA
jgi:hypothetical protein